MGDLLFNFDASFIRFVLGSSGLHAISSGPLPSGRQQASHPMSPSQPTRRSTPEGVGRLQSYV